MITINDISILVRSLLEAEEASEMAELKLKQAKEQVRLLKEETIPGAMQELGLESLVLDTGHKLTCTQEVYASIPVSNRGAAFRWLEDNGYGGLIKTELSVVYGKGELEQAVQLEHELADRGCAVDISQSVHPQTLKAFIKEQLAEGTGIPLELFGARPVITAKISTK